MSNPNNLEIKKYIAELIGTFILVFAGCGSAIFGGGQGSVGVAFAFGLSVLVMVYTIGSLSGCHINPAVSVSMLAAGKMKAKDTVFYIIFQCIGAIMGAGVLYLIKLDTISTGMQVTNLGQNIYAASSSSGSAIIAALIAEIVCTFIFVLVIHGALSKKAPKGFAGIAIGCALTLVHLVLIPITNASVNPARSLGPALFIGGVALEQLWLFWVAPIIGGILAAAVWKMLAADDKDKLVDLKSSAPPQIEQQIPA